MCAHEVKTVIEEIESLLKPHSDVVGQVTLHSDFISTKLNGAELVIRARIVNDEGTHPSIAHVHVIVESEKVDLKGHFDACVLGVDSDRTSAIKNAANNWFVAAAGAIFSLLHARPVLNAEHFCGDEIWGVEGAHGFAGPMIVRLSSDPTLAEQLIEKPLFQYASSLAPSGVVHLVKSTLNIVNGQWCRNVEVDGHSATYKDVTWDAQLPAPKQIVASRFATFHYADQPEKVAQREQLDNLIRKYVDTLGQLRDSDKTFHSLVQAGFPERLVDRVEHFLPTAIGRVMITSHMPIRPAQTYHRVLPNGEFQRDLPLMSEPAFARSLVLAESLAQTHLEALKELALCSSEVDAINNLLHAGGKLDGCQGSPFLVPDFETSKEVFEKAFQSESVRLAQQRPTNSRQSRKPWWKIW